MTQVSLKSPTAHSSRVFPAHKQPKLRPSQSFMFSKTACPFKHSSVFPLLGLPVYFQSNSCLCEEILLKKQTTTKNNPHTLKENTSSLNLNTQTVSVYLLPSGFPHSSVGKESAGSAGDPGSIPGLVGSSGEGNGTPLQYSCLENPMDRGAWRTTHHGVSRVGPDLVTKSPPTTFFLQHSSTVPVLEDLSKNKNFVGWTAVNELIFINVRTALITEEQDQVSSSVNLCMDASAEAFPFLPCHGQNSSKLWHSRRILSQGTPSIAISAAEVSRLLF